jgi:rhamnosyltransferase subunit B
MAKILLGNQWGGGVGHVLNLRALADQLQANGHQPVLALPDLIAARPAMEGVSYPVLQGPVWRGALRPRKQTRTFADILANQAFADVNVFGTLALAWRELIGLLKPDLVVTEYAPVLSLAARNIVPVAAFGSPFCLPPSHTDEFPVLNIKAPKAYPEGELLSAINAWLVKNGSTSLTKLAEIHPPDNSYPFGLIEMDPYREFRETPVLPPLSNSLPAPLEDNRPDGPPRIFCYLMAQHKPSMKLLVMLAEGGIAIEAYIKECNPLMVKKMAERGITVHQNHVPIREALANAHLLLHNGSTILAHEALAMGRAQLCFPMDLEKELNSRNLASLGVARIIRQGDLQPQVAQRVKELCFDADFYNRARTVAEELAKRNFDDPITQIIEKLKIFLK